MFGASDNKAKSNNKSTNKMTQFTGRQVSEEQLWLPCRHTTNRRSANLRERKRMRLINEAFVGLQSHIPPNWFAHYQRNAVDRLDSNPQSSTVICVSGSHSQSQSVCWVNRSLSKVNILRAAIAYINQLHHLLHDAGAQFDPQRCSLLLAFNGSYGRLSEWNCEQACCPPIRPNNEAFQNVLTTCSCCDPVVINPKSRESLYLPSKPCFNPPLHFIFVSHCNDSRLDNWLIGICHFSCNGSQDRPS